MKKITIEDTAQFTTEIVVEKPPYMSDEEFTQHLRDVTMKVDPKGMAPAFERQLEEMGFNIVETESNFPRFPANVKSHISKIEDVGGDT